MSLVHESLGEAKTRDDISQNAWKYLKITLEELEEGSGEKVNYHGLFGPYHMAAIFLLLRVGSSNAAIKRKMLSAGNLTNNYHFTTL